MSRFVQGADRQQQTLLPECLDDYVAKDNPVRVVNVFVNELDLKELGFEAMTPAVTGRPAYHPAMLLKLYVYGYLNKVQFSRRLEREAQPNGWLRTTKPLPTSVVRMVRRSRRSVVSSWYYAASWACSVQPSSPSMDQSSRR